MKHVDILYGIFYLIVYAYTSKLLKGLSERMEM